MKFYLVYLSQKFGVEGRADWWGDCPIFPKATALVASVLSFLLLGTVSCSSGSGSGSGTNTQTCTAPSLPDHAKSGCSGQSNIAIGSECAVYCNSNYVWADDVHSNKYKVIYCQSSGSWSSLSSNCGALAIV